MSEAACRIAVKTRAARPDPVLDEFSRFLPCEHCGHYVGYFEMHHRLFRSHGGGWVPSNIILLCLSCHHNTTDERLAGFGLNCRSWEKPEIVPVWTWYAGFVLLDDEGGYTVA